MFKMKEKLFKKRGVMAFATAVAVSFSILSSLSSELVPSIGITMSAAEVENGSLYPILPKSLRKRKDWGIMFIMILVMTEF